MRLLHDPPQDAAEDNLFGQVPHTDNSFMTVLARSEVPGLAVRLPSGRWLAPPLIPGTFLDPFRRPASTPVENRI